MTPGWTAVGSSTDGRWAVVVLWIEMIENRGFMAHQFCTLGLQRRKEGDEEDERDCGGASNVQISFSSVELLKRLFGDEILLKLSQSCQIEGFSFIIVLVMMFRPSSSV